MKVDKRITLGLISLAIAIALIIGLYFLTKIPSQSKEDIVLTEGLVIPKDRCSLLDKVTVIHSTGCSACAIAIPRLQELENELEMKFEYYDITIEQDKNKIISTKLIPEAVPTVIINCKVYVGVKSKEEYKNAIINQNG